MWWGSGSSDSSKIEVPENADGVASDLPVIAYTEQVIAEKEASLRKYIQDNYAKLQAVERELEALRLEVKLTSGSKKAAMELLRSKIEESTERIKGAREREKQAQLALEAASRAVQEEENHKQELCDDLRTMIQESALQQYEKLEALTHKLDALNPELKGAALEAIEGLRAKIAPHGAPIMNGASEKERAAAQTLDAGTIAAPSPAAAASASGTAPAAGPVGNAAGQVVGEGKVDGQSEEVRGRQSGSGPAEVGSSEAAAGGTGPARTKPGVQLKGHGGRAKAGTLLATKGTKASESLSLGGRGGWTGAGFDVGGGE